MLKYLAGAGAGFSPSGIIISSPALSPLTSASLNEIILSASSLYLSARLSAVSPSFTVYVKPSTGRIVSLVSIAILSPERSFSQRIVSDFTPNFCANEGTVSPSLTTYSTASSLVGASVVTICGFATYDCSLIVRLTLASTFEAKLFTLPATNMLVSLAIILATFVDVTSSTLILPLGLKIRTENASPLFISVSNNFGAKSTPTTTSNTPIGTIV